MGPTILLSLIIDYAQCPTVLGYDSRENFKLQMLVGGFWSILAKFIHPICQDELAVFVHTAYNSSHIMSISLPDQ